MSDQILTYTDTKASRLADDNEFTKTSWKLTRSLGVPPKYNMDIDLQYTNEIGAGYGRVYSRTILSNPTIISICPGKVKMFPNFSKDSESSELIQALEGSCKNEMIMIKLTNEKKENSGWSSKLFTFQSNTAEYAKYLNVLCRAAAIMMGIGEEKMPNTSIKLKHFDYAYWTYRNSFVQVAEKDQYRTIWTDFWKAGMTTASGLVSDTNYIHFFVNNQETSISEQMQTSTSAPPLFGDIASTVASTSAALNYFIGSGIEDSELMSDLTSSVNSAIGNGKGDSWMAIASNLLQGGQLVFPEMLSECTYNKDIRCSFDFLAPYGDPLSIFLWCAVPAFHLLVFGLPRQMSDNMYTYPFVVRVYQQGMFNSDLAIISNIELTRGGDDSTQWTIDGLSTAWNVTISVTPLYTELMLTASDHPFRFMKNEGLLEYLGNLCGLDLKANNLTTKKELWTAFLYDSITDIPSSLGRKLGQKFLNKMDNVTRFFTKIY